jgi:hypothetical protein
MIDDNYLQEAESELRNLFKLTENNLNIDSENELIYISESKINNIMKYYSLIQKRYAGNYREIVMKLELKDREIESKNKEIKNNNKIYKMEIESKNKEIINNKELYIKDLQIKDKDLQIEKMKNILLSNNIKI